MAYFYAGLVISLKVGGFLVLNNLFVYQAIVGVKIQASLKSILYRKALNLSLTSGTNLGNLITLITKDITMVETNLWLLRDFLVFWIQFFTIAYLMYKRMGFPAFIGLGMIGASIPVLGEIYLTS